jgi:hypothetical protein
MYLRQIDFAILIAVRDATPLSVYGSVTPRGDFSSRRCCPTPHGEFAMLGRYALSRRRAFR